MDCECPVNAPHNFTVKTFDLFLAEITNGIVGTDQLIGNVVTGTLEDDSEDFDAFNPSGQDQFPFSVSARTGLRLLFTTDEITCDNLTRFFSLDPSSALGADRYGFDVVTPRKIYRATLEHIYPCGTIVTVGFHRSCVVSRASWLFSPDTIHALAFELRAFPTDDEANKFGYMDLSPGACATS